MFVLRTMSFIFIGYCLFFSGCALSALSFDEETQQPLTAVASKIEDKITQLPEEHLMTQGQQRYIDRLLSEVLDEQQQQISVFQQSLRTYRQSKDNDKNWQKVKLGYYSTLSLSQSKEQLLLRSTPHIYNLVTGFGPDGVTQFKSESLLTRLNIEFYLYKEELNFHRFIADLKISPVPVVVVFFKVFIVILLMKYLLKNSQRFIQSLQNRIQGTNNKSYFFSRIVWYISRTDKAIIWLICITFCLRIVSTLPSLKNLIFLEIFIWWILGGAILVGFMVEFAFQHSKRLPKELISLRLSTIQLFVWGFITSGLVGQISAMTLGKGTIYAWIFSLIYSFFAIATLYSLRQWKSYIFSLVDSDDEHPFLVRWAIKSKDRWLTSSLATILVAGWYLLIKIQKRLIASLSEYTFFSHALAYLFRIEVAKQTRKSQIMNDLVQIRGKETLCYVRLEHDESLVVESYAKQEITELKKYLHSDKPAVCIVSGERGIGTTALLHRVIKGVDNATPLYIDCPLEGYQGLLEKLASHLNITDEANEENILKALRTSEVCYLMAFDNIQRLVKPRVGGLDQLMSFTNLLRRVYKSHRALLAIASSSWRFVDRARGERLLFDLVSFMPRWSELEINQLVDSRILDEGPYALSFDSLALPRQWDKEELSEKDRAKKGFYRILWDYSDGNPTVALRFFRRSLFRNEEGVQVNVFKTPSSEGLDKMEKPMLAILRAIVQLEIATHEELRDCTQLSITEVISTLRYFQSRGFIEWSNEKTRISDLWFRNITDTLHRQHLLVK